MKPRPKGYPYHTLIETYRSWGRDPGLEACLRGHRPSGFTRFVRVVLNLKKVKIYKLTGDYEQGLRVGQKALEEAGVAGLALGRAQALLALGWMLYGTSEFRRMGEAAQEALELFSAQSEPGGQAAALRQLGIVDYELGNWERSQANYERALELYERKNDRLGKAACLHKLSGFYNDRGEHEKALELAERALRLSEEAGSLYTQAQCWEELSNIQRDLGNTALGLEHLKRMRTLYQTIGSRSGQATALHNIAFMEAALGNYDEAISSYEHAYALDLSVGNRSGSAYDLSNLGKAYEDLGDFERSAANHEKALALWRDLGQRRALAFGLVLLVHAALGKGDLAGARKACEEVRSLIKEYASDNDLLCHLAQGAAALALEENDLSQASLEIETGFLLAEALGFKIYQASLHFLRARLKERQGDWPGAQIDYEESASLYGSLGEKARLARPCFFYSRALLAHGEEDKGRWYLTEARRLWEAIGAKSWLAKAEDPS